jgi:hypothetical protein
MSYDLPTRETYFLPSGAFGATTDSIKVVGPKGKVGLVRDIIAELSADAVGTTTVPEVAVGLTLGSNEYARFRLGTAAGAGYAAANTPYRASTLAASAPGNTGGVPPALSDYPGHVALEKARIPADTPVFISRVAGAGGVPAGTGGVRVQIDWF